MPTETKEAAKPVKPGAEPKGGKTPDETKSVPANLARRQSLEEGYEGFAEKQETDRKPFVESIFGKGSPPTPKEAKQEDKPKAEKAPEKKPEPPKEAAAVAPLTIDDLQKQIHEIKQATQSRFDELTAKNKSLEAENEDLRKKSQEKTEPQDPVRQATDQNLMDTLALADPSVLHFGRKELGIPVDANPMTLDLETRKRLARYNLEMRNLVGRELSRRERQREEAPLRERMQIESEWQQSLNRLTERYGELIYKPGTKEPDMEKPVVKDFLEMWNRRKDDPRYSRVGDLPEVVFALVKDRHTGLEQREALQKANELQHENERLKSRTSPEATGGSASGPRPKAPKKEVEDETDEDYIAFRKREQRNRMANR